MSIKHEDNFEATPVIFLSCGKYKELKGMFEYEEQDLITADGGWIEDFLSEISEDEPLTSQTIILFEYLQDGGNDYTFIIEK